MNENIIGNVVGGITKLNDIENGFTIVELINKLNGTTIGTREDLTSTNNGVSTNKSIH